MSAWIIYKVTSPSKKAYIGISSNNLLIRKANHIKTMNAGTSYKFHRALRKYGVENCIWEVIDIALSQTEAHDKEKYYIKTLNTYNNGYNSTLGGEGTLGKRHSLETRKKLSKATKNFNKTLNSEELYKKVNLMCNLNKKKVIDNSGNIFDSVVEAAKFYNLDKSYVAKAARQQLICRNNLCFKYYIDGDSQCPTFKKKPKIFRCCPENRKLKMMEVKSCKPLIDQFDKKYSSITVASKILKISRTQIRNSIKNGKVVKGFRFSYVR